MAGLGEPIPPTVDALAPAWDPTGAGDVRAARLLPMALSHRQRRAASRIWPASWCRGCSRARRSGMDITAPGFGIPADPAGPRSRWRAPCGRGRADPALAGRGACRVRGAAQPKLNAPAQALRETGGARRWRRRSTASGRRPPGPGGAGGPPWFDELNLTPQLRVLARARGREVVQTRAAGAAGQRLEPGGRPARPIRS